MYMGVILKHSLPKNKEDCAPHVYGGDPDSVGKLLIVSVVLPMYMGVIPGKTSLALAIAGAPHVYGGDPN